MPADPGATPSPRIGHLDINPGVQHYAGMRTTLTLDPDVEQLLKREMRRAGRSMKAVVNDALRAGLGAAGKPPGAPPYAVEPHDFGFRPGIDTDRLDRLVDETAGVRSVRKIGR